MSMLSFKLQVYKSKHRFSYKHMRVKIIYRRVLEKQWQSKQETRFKNSANILIPVNAYFDLSVRGREKENGGYSCKLGCVILPEAVVVRKWRWVSVKVSLIIGRNSSSSLYSTYVSDKVNAFKKSRLDKVLWLIPKMTTTLGSRITLIIGYSVLTKWSQKLTSWDNSISSSSKKLLHLVYGKIITI